MINRFLFIKKTLFLCFLVGLIEIDYLNLSSIALQMSTLIPKRIAPNSLLDRGAQTSPDQADSRLEAQAV